MKRLLLAGVTLLALWLTGSWPARAQVEAPAVPTQEQPASEPKAISRQELQQFANAVRQILAIDLEAQTKILQAVQNQGFSPQEYLEILQGQQNSEAQPNPEVTEEKMVRFERAREQVLQIEQAAQLQMQQAVEAEGLEVQRFVELSAAIQQDPTLQQQVEQLLQNQPGAPPTEADISDGL